MKKAEQLTEEVITLRRKTQDSEKELYNLRQVNLCHHQQHCENANVSNHLLPYFLLSMQEIFLFSISVFRVFIEDLT